jgi:sporulation protein YabP
MEQSVKREQAHNLTLQNREKLAVSGVTDVDAYDEAKIVLFTAAETLEIEGANLHINRLNVEDGELVVEGDVQALTYYGKQGGKNKGGFFKNIFK